MKRKGFTLIELLAVIVILAIIALIAVPVIMNIIDKSSKKAFENSGYGIIRAGELYYSERLLTPEGMAADKEFTFPDNYTGLEIKGSKPTRGKIIVKKDGKVGMAISNGKYCVKKSYDKEEISIDEDLNNCNIPGAVVGFLPSGLTKGTAVYVNPDTKSICSESEAVSTTGTKTGCMKWYVYKDNGDSTYQLILDHNTTAIVVWNLNELNTSMGQIAIALTNDTSTWNKSLNARLITADEIAEITGNTTFQGSTTNNTYFYFDSNTQSGGANSTNKSKYAWLYDYTKDCTTYGCNIADRTNEGYWTSTPVAGSNNHVWYVKRYGSLYYGNARFGDSVISGSTFGLRPVITL